MTQHSYGTGLTVVDSSATAASQTSNVRQVFLSFLRLGLTSFGGPIAHLGYFRTEFVGRRKWLTEEQYAELVAVCQFLPGPTSSQVGFAVGLRTAGYRGALAAWLAFTLPSALLMVAIAMGSGLFTGTIGAGLIAGLKCVAVAVVAHAVWGMARSLTPDLRRIVIAFAAAGIVLLAAGTLGQVAAIAIGAIAGLLSCRGLVKVASDERELFTSVSRRAGVISLMLLVTGLVALPILATVSSSSLLSLTDALYRTGALVFGGGHVVLPLTQAELAIAQTMSTEQLLTGYAAAQAMPGPLFTFAAYIGALSAPGAAGLLSAAVALVAIFVPGMLLLIGILPFWGRLRTKPLARAALHGANAAVVGVLAAALINPIFITSVTGAATFSIVVGALIMLVLRAPAWVVVIVGALAGVLGGLVGWY